MSMSKSKSNWFRRHPVWTSIILIVPAFLGWFGGKIIYPFPIVNGQETFFSVWLGGSPTATFSLLLAPYFWVLWIWRHNDKEADKFRNQTQDKDIEFYKILELASSNYEYIAIAGFKRINRYLDLNDGQLENEKLQILFDIMIESTSTTKGNGQIYYRIDALKIALKIISIYNVGNIYEIKTIYINHEWVDSINSGKDGFCIPNNEVSLIKMLNGMLIWSTNNCISQN